MWAALSRVPWVPLTQAVEHNEIVLAPRLVSQEVEQVGLKRLTPFAGQLGEAVTQLFRDIPNLQGNHACSY